MQIFKNAINLFLLKRFYSRKAPRAHNAKPIVVYMCDGRKLHGGLADRLSGFVSTYDYCMSHNKEFRANFIFPYELQCFLEPNRYDWTINPIELSYNSKDSAPVLITYKKLVPAQQRYAERELNKSKLQLHVYTNMKYDYPTNFKYSFEELFRPSKILADAISREKKYLDKKYVSVTFRFQQLLGDFKERNFPVLKTQRERAALIERCLAFVVRVHKIHPEMPKILVTSDSMTFLGRVSELPYVHIIKGKIVHMDYDGYNSGTEVHIKSFIDLFMIANADKIYNVVLPPLYKTSFPYIASLIYGHQYIELSESREYRVK